MRSVRRETGGVLIVEYQSAITITNPVEARIKTARLSPTESESKA
jgi:hypothetical protein